MAIALESTVPLVSICIPTYNGAATLPGLLAQLLQQSEVVGTGVLEVLISDDCSSDNTFAIAQEWAEQFPFIKCFENAANLGMDGNFRRSAELATGRYIWFCGQDDGIEIGAISKFLSLLAEHSDIGLAYFNYGFFADDMQTEVQAPCLNLEHDQVLQGSEAYFSVLDHAPSFLPATIIRRDLWESAPLELFRDTVYVQMGGWLWSLTKEVKVAIVASPAYIKCRMPGDSWKFTNHKMLLDIFWGSLQVYARVAKERTGIVPMRILWTQYRRFLLFFPVLVARLAPSLPGYRQYALARAKSALPGWLRVFYYAYCLPVALLPSPLLKVIAALGKIVGRARSLN